MTTQLRSLWTLLLLLGLGVVTSCAGVQAPAGTSQSPTAAASPAMTPAKARQLAHAQAVDQPVRWLLNAQIIDPDKQTVTTGHIRIKSGRIARVTAKLPTAPGPGSLDLKGRFVLPGLVDLHVHSWGNPSPQKGPDHACGHAETARLMLYSGVVAYLDLGSKEQTIFALRQRLRSGKAKGAALYAAGPVLGRITTAKSHVHSMPNSADRQLRQVDGPKSARLHVQQLALHKPDFVKVLMDHTGDSQNVTQQTLAAIVDEARRHHLRVICHIGTWVDARMCLDAGAHALTHLWDEDDIAPKLLKDLAAAGIPLIPTQPVQVDMPHFAGPKVSWSQLARAVSPASLRKAYSTPATFVKKAAFWHGYQPQHVKDYERQLRALHKAGVRLLAGSDSGNFGTFHGYSLHRELLLMHRAGVPPWAVLKAGTTNAGRFLGLKLGVGPGAEATLVVLGASPLADMANTQRIVHVIQHGKLIDRKALLTGGSVGVPPCDAAPKLWPHHSTTHRGQPK
ncbi:MAG: amidohydrolase family protein [Myxococcales bacterium]|nr:amidohydrolase family protein [Myxococcales bacterium]